MSETPKHVALTVPGNPIPKGRPRVYRGRGVTPKRTRDAEKRIRDAYQAAYRDTAPYDEPVEMVMYFWRDSRQVADLDNLAKLVQDALNGVAYTDDRLIVKLRAQKILPDTCTIGTHGWRKRRAGDPLTHRGIPYEPHTHIRIYPINS